MPPILRGFRVAVPVCVSAAVSFLSLRCCLLVGSHLIRNQLIAQIGIVRRCKTIANTIIHRRVATTRRRHKDGERHSHGRAAPRPRHGGHVQGRHDVQGTTATPRPRRDHDGHGHDRIQRNVPARYHTTRQNTTEQTFQRCTMQQTPPWGSAPRRKKQGRLLSSADAECSLEHFWITRYLRSLHIFSGCNRFCTLHIVYNVPWIDVDGGRAQLGSASISGCYHSLRVA